MEESMEKKALKVGDVVRVTDGSYAVRIDAVEQYPLIGLNTNDFVVKRMSHSTHLRCGNGKGQVVHDIWIRDTVTNKVYLHSSGMTRVIQTVCPTCGQLHNVK